MSARRGRAAASTFRNAAETSLCLNTTSAAISWSCTIGWACPSAASDRPSVAGDED